jgi:hypothetical protein
MLNLHGVISCGFSLERLFHDLRRKHEGEYVYGKQFVTDTALGITETLDTLFFYLNALTRGSDVALFHIHDELKRQIGKSIDYKEAGESIEVDDRPKAMDPIPALLGIITDYTVDGEISETGSLSGTLESPATIHDILNYCYDRTFDMLDSLIRSLVAEDRLVVSRSSSIMGVPTSYLLQERRPVFETLPASGETNDVPHSNGGASRLIEGIYDVEDSDLYTSFVERPRRDTDIRGMLIYSNETLASYHSSGKFRNMVCSNICEAVGGNHIDLLIGPASGAGLPSSSRQLVKKLLDWLDFRTFAGHGFVVASIRNITRSQTENHLNMLGKLLSFIASTRIPPSDDESVDRNTEIFLENII